MKYRKYLKNPILEEESDQMKGLPIPPIQKPYPDDAKLVDLGSPDDIKCKEISLQEAINNRESHRKYIEEPLTTNELSFLLWATQGVKSLARNGLVTMRTVPSGAAIPQSWRQNRQLFR